LTQKQFIAQYPVGVYLVRVKGHAFVIRDGQVIDFQSRCQDRHRRRILGAYKVLDAAPISTHLPAMYSSYVKKIVDEIKRMGPEFFKGS
jgi:hypothetical protein